MKMKKTVGVFAALCAGAAVAAPLEVFWDDAAVDVAKTTATRVLHRPEYVEVALVHDEPWEGDGCVYHNIVPDRDEKGVLYRLYYTGFGIKAGYDDPKYKFSDDGVRICYAESRDGIKWTKPNLGLCEFQGSKKNNIILDIDPTGGGFEEFGVFRDDNPKCPPAERYKGLTKRARGQRLLVCYVSPDGIHFRRGWEILAGKASFDSLNNAFWEPADGLYHLYCRGIHDRAGARAENNGERVRDIRHATSADFKTWTDPVPLVYEPDENGKPREDYAFYTNVIWPYFRAPHLRVGFPSRYVERVHWSGNYDRLPQPQARRDRMRKAGERNGLAITDAIFMFSRDGQTFHREDEAFLTPGPEGAWNWVYADSFLARGMMLVPSARGGDDEIALFDTEGQWSGGPKKMVRYRIRQDGFVSRHAPYRGAKVVTKPVVCGESLAINFATSARGRIFVTVRDVENPRDRFSDTVEMFGDKVDAQVPFRWTLSNRKLVGRKVTIEFDMSDADIYSFRFK